MNSLTLRSPAKLNLYLKVHNKRKDGFHNITTVFERIDLSDEIRLKINPKSGIKIHCQHPQVPRGPKNLCFRVAQKLIGDFGIKKGVDIRIQKNIPVAAGLGGGSSNAATVLLGLNRLFNLKLSQKSLVRYAAQIGSDVAFFLYNYPWAVGTGRGEVIRKLNIPRRFWHVLVVPKIKVYTKEVYGGLRGYGVSHGAPTKMLTRSTSAKSGHSVSTLSLSNVLTKNTNNVNILISYLTKSNVIAVGRCLTNDLEAVVFRQYPNLEKLKKRLKLLSNKGVMVSGSGPSVFSLAGSLKEAQALKRVLSKRYARVFITRTL